MKRNLVPKLLAALLVVVLWYVFGAHRPPAGQPPLAAMDLAKLRADFNAAKDRTRLILLLSPT